MNKTLNSLLVFALILVSASTIAANKSLNVIYGDDNRVDVKDSTTPEFVHLSKSTAAMIPNKAIKKGMFASNYKINSKRLHERGICKSERFANQLTAAMCSGFLVGPKHIVTAGHCITDMSRCKGNKWVFGYKVKNTDSEDMTAEESQVYSCTKIIAQSFSQYSRRKADYALIELDREVTGVDVLKFRKAGKPIVKDPLVVIGHPTGLPTKISDGANVRTLAGNYFTANLDTYGGNSGSAVFNTTTGEVEGILVRGDTDYVKSPKGCKVSNRVADDKGMGEHVTYITEIKELLNL